ncbi:sensor histidine kinase [Candidatus Woesearchaeota archaeon]|nr:sensor histidine kinase [Candidatus Woesearchaeota archaeon]
MEVELNSLSDSKENHLETYFSSNQEYLKLITSRTKLRDTLKLYNTNSNEEYSKIMTKILIDALSSTESIERVCILGLDGRIISSTSKCTLSENMFREKFFINGKTKYGSYILEDENSYKIITTGPIKLEDDLLGVGLISVNLNHLEEIITNREGMGVSTETLVAIKNNHDLVFLFDRLYEVDAVEFLDDDIAKPMVLALSEKEEFIPLSKDYRGVEVLAVTRYIPEVSVGIVTKMDYSEAIGDYKTKMQLLLLLIFIGSFFTLIIIGSYLSKKITMPLDLLSLANEQLRKGNFNTKVSIKTGDELEKFADTYNDTIKVLEGIQEQQKEIEKAKTEFMSITSHELRSPMTPMKVQLQLILREHYGKLNKKQKKSLEMILRNTIRLDEIIVDFLEVSRIEAARLKFNFAKVNLEKSVISLVDEMKHFMPDKNISFDLNIKKLPMIEVDASRVVQILRNLLNNAIKFSPKNSTIKIKASKKNNFIEFSVADEGIGIPEKYKDRLFEPFYQVQNMYQHVSGGTGLGLAICRGIVKSQKGDIWVESKLHEGSKFSFTIPLKPVKKIEPIKLLFRGHANLDEDLIKTFGKILGPIGKIEFEKLKREDKIKKDELFKYVENLYKQGILEKEKKQEFINKIKKVFGSDEKSISKKKNKKRTIK